MAYTADILTSSIVVIGDFNPVIFSPDWLEKNKLIGESDASKAREGSQGRETIISRQVTTFETEWFTLQVLENKFTLTSKGVLSLSFKDLAVGIFQLVSHTPVKAIGINFIAHFKLSSWEEQHKIGDAIAPKDIWDSLFKDTFAGLEQIVIRIQQGSRDKVVDTKDEKRITVQPSRLFKYGVNLSFNDHHEFSTSEENDLTPAEQVAMIIDEQMDSTQKDAVRVFDQVLSKTLEG